MSNSVNVTLTIAGNDASGGAGIAADLKTFAEYGTFGIAALAVVASMDKETWKHAVSPIDLDTLKAQLETATSVQQGIAAFKTGMLPSVGAINLVHDHVKEYGLRNFVLDPVMVCKGDDEVLDPESAIALRDQLLPLAKVVTPNLFEAGQLAGIPEPKTVTEMKQAAQKIIDLGAQTVVVKGGRAIEGEEAIDIFYDGDEFIELSVPKIKNANNHGAGCTLAAAITGGLAQGLSSKDAVKKAKTFVTSAIKGGFPYNRHVGPVFHSAHRLNKES